MAGAPASVETEQILKSAIVNTVIIGMCTHANVGTGFHTFSLHIVWMTSSGGVPRSSVMIEN